MTKAKYNEGNLISTMDNPVWSMKRTGIPITPTHKPDAYWYKYHNTSYKEVPPEHVEGGYSGYGSYGGSGGTGAIPNRATLVAEHSPGFFSCLWHEGKLYMGTYSGGTNGHCQLCVLENDKVRVLHTFDGESLYHIRGYPGYMFLAIEQGNLYRRNDDGEIIKLRNRSLHMGFYDACWCGNHWYAVEKMNVRPPNKVAIYRDGNDWFTSNGWKAKDMMCMNGKLYLTATGIGSSDSGDVGSSAIAQIDPTTKHTSFVTSQYHGCWTGGLGIYDNKAWATIDCSGKVFNTAGWSQNLGNQAWFVGEVSGNLFATTGGHWRGEGPSHLYNFDKAQNKFVKIMDFPDAEPWDVCRGETAGIYYLVTRNQQGSLGRVYRIDRRDVIVGGDQPCECGAAEGGECIPCGDTLDTA